MNLVLDVDGVLTTGQFLYSAEGKTHKIFGPHDSDGLKLIKDKINIFFITADKRGFPITKKRIEDMGFSVELVSEEERYNFIKNKFGFENTIYMGDGIHDAKIIHSCKFGIAPANARIEARDAAKFVTPSKSAEGAVLDACLEINRRFFSEGRYRACILAAGVGSRMGEFTEFFNKAMVPVKGKPAICHIIEKIPREIEIVVALGYMGKSLKSFILSSYPERKFVFVEVDKFTGPGTGPGYSLLQCKDYLQCPFVYESVDTLFSEGLPTLSDNWFGVANVKDTERFCSAKVENGVIVRIDDKVKNDNKFAFIGLAGIKDYEIFWNALENNKLLINNEIQVSNGFKALVGKNLKAAFFTWFDTGTKDSLRHAQINYPYGQGYGGD